MTDMASILAQKPKILIKLANGITTRIVWELVNERPVIYMPGCWKATLRTFVNLMHERHIEYVLPSDLAVYLHVE